METEPLGTVQIEKKPVSSYRIVYSCMNLENSFYQEFCDKLMIEIDAISGMPVSRNELPIMPVTIDNVENILSNKQTGEKYGFNREEKLADTGCMYEYRRTIYQSRRNMYFEYWRYDNQA